METEKIIKNWLEGAEKDWLACQHLYEKKDYSQCLFWGHLVIEKLLKALIVQTLLRQAPYSHDLVLLAREAKLELSPEQKDQLNEITTFNQFARYDNEVMKFMEKCTQEYTQKYFNNLNSLRLWLIGFFPKQS